MKQLFTIATVVLALGVTSPEASAPPISVAKFKKLEKRVRELEHTVDFCEDRYIRVAPDFSGYLAAQPTGDVLIPVIRDDRRCVE